MDVEDSTADLLLQLQEGGGRRDGGGYIGFPAPLEARHRLGPLASLQPGRFRDGHACVGAEREHRGYPQEEFFQPRAAPKHGAGGEAARRHKARVESHAGGRAYARHRPAQCVLVGEVHPVRPARSPVSAEIDPLRFDDPLGEHVAQRPAQGGLAVRVAEAEQQPDIDPFDSVQCRGGVRGEKIGDAWGKPHRKQGGRPGLPP